MAQHRAILFLLLAAFAIAAGCSGQSSITPTQSLMISPHQPPRHHRSTHKKARFAIAIFGVFSGRHHKVISRWLGWIDMKTGRKMPRGWSPRVSPATTWTPAPTPSPGWAGYLPDCNNSSGYYCLYILPDGYTGPYDIVEQWQCYQCSGNWTAYFQIVPTYAAPTPPPEFNVTGITSDNPSNKINCTSGCNLTTCQTCYAQVTQDATDAPPANFGTNFCNNGNFCFRDWITSLPTAQDVDINSGTQWVNYNPIPVPQMTLPPPVMVGQQVQLQASPAPVLTNVTWTFDSTAATDVVGNGFVANVSVVGTPQPVPSSGNPVSFYWVSANVPSGVRFVRMNAQDGSIIGPLFADVYYPVATPSPTVSYQVVSKVAISNYYAPQGPIGCPSPTVVLALDLGNICAPSGNPGIAMNYSVQVPSYGGGDIAIAQIVNINFSGVLNGGNVYFTPGPGLDYQFPYGNNEQQTGQTINTNDSPAYYVGQSSCSSVTLAETFTDYFMYEPTATSNRPSIWVSDFVGTWPKWGGTANYSRGKWTLKSPVNPQPTASPPSSAMPAWNAWIRNPLFPC